MLNADISLSRPGKEGDNSINHNNFTANGDELNSESMTTLIIVPTNR